MLQADSGMGAAPPSPTSGGCEGCRVPVGAVCWRSLSKRPMHHSLGVPSMPITCGASAAPAWVPACGKSRSASRGDAPVVHVTGLYMTPMGRRKAAAHGPWPACAHSEGAPVCQPSKGVYGLLLGWPVCCNWPVSAVRWLHVWHWPWSWWTPSRPFMHSYMGGCSSRSICICIAHPMCNHCCHCG